MAEVLPQIRPRADTQPREADSKLETPTVLPLRDATNHTANGRINSSESVEARQLPITKGYPSKFMQTLSGNQANATSKSPAAEERRDSQAIDPLSHHILNRTSTLNTFPPKVRSGTAEEDNGESETSPSAVVAQTSSEPTTVRNDSAGPGIKDKRNRVSFFSRFAPKRKDVLPDINDNDSEAGDKRTEGMDAEIFSQPIGYIPQFPPPPKYIKVRSHGKKEKDFQRLFLAQELRGRSGVEIAQSGGRLVKNGAYKHGNKDGNAIWAMEFSKDGKYLAAGGKDYVVRVWVVLSTKEERQGHEREEDVAAKAGQSVRLNAPVFKTKTVQEYGGHTASVLDLSWSKNNFILSSSMDKTVRLWHVSRPECLCCFKHSDFVTSIQFHPRDDRFFLAGSLDSKLRLWSIPDKSVAYWSQTPDLITAVAFAPDGKTAIAGCLNGLCLFYETEGLKYQTQIHVRSAHGKNAKGSKVTGIQAINHPPEDPNGEVKLLITSNDSRVRVYNLRDKGLELKLKGNENSCSQIHASFSDDARYIICGSEDRKAYIWSTGQPETERDKRPPEVFEAHSAIVTTAIMAPTKTRQLLSASGDPLYDLCNPPPVTLISRTQSQTSSIPPMESSPQPDNNMPSTPATPDLARATKPEESPAYLARCAHPDGNIIVTADFLGHIKIFRQDCAYQNRLRNRDSALSKKMLGRTSSVATKNGKSSRRDSLQMGHPSSERIHSWRQSIASNNGSIDRLSQQRSSSPRKSLGAGSLQSARYPSQNTIISTPSLASTSQQHSPHRSSDESKDLVLDLEKSSLKHPKLGAKHPTEANPLMLRGEQSYMFWNSSVYQAQAATASHLGPNYDLNHHNHNGHSPKASTAGSSNGSSVEGHHAHLGAPMAKAETQVSRLSSEEESVGASRRRFIASKGCKPIRKWRNKDPFLGLDFLYALYKAMREHRGLEMMKDRFDTLGVNTAHITILTGTFVATTEPENLKCVLASDFRSYSLATGRKEWLRPFLGKGIFTTDGKEWQHSREMLRPNFVRTQIGDVDMFERHVQHLIQAIPTDGSTVHLQDLFFQFSLDVATDLLFGESTNTLAPDFADAEVAGFVDAYDYCIQALDGISLTEEGGGLAWGILGLFLPNRKLKQQIGVVNNFVDKLVENAMTNRDAHNSAAEKHPTSRYVFLHELVSQTTDKIKIRSELLNILLAGRDSSASLLSNVWFELSNRPDVWRRLQRDVDSVNGECPTFEKLKDMKYLRAVLNESLRLYPVVPENARQADVDTTLPVGGGEDGKSPVFVQKGQLVHWSLYTMHRRKDLYGDDAAEFKPERWLDRGGTKGLRVGWEYLPFNGGPRICIGQQFALTEASYVTVRLMQHFPTIESRDPEPWREKQSLTCTGLGGCKVALFPTLS